MVKRLSLKPIVTISMQKNALFSPKEQNLKDMRPSNKKYIYLKFFEFSTQISSYTPLFM